MDNDNNNSPIAPSKKSIIIKKSLKYIGIALIMIVYIAIFLRMCTAGDPPSSGDYIWTSAAIEYANKNGMPEIMTQEFINTLDENGRFRVNNTRITDALSLFQITVRYNNSTVTRMAEDMSLPEIPTGEVYVYTLEASDGTVYSDYSFTTASKTVYNFRTLVFNGVSYVDASGNPITSLTLHIYYIDNFIVDEPYQSFTVYNSERMSTAVKLDDKIPAEPTKQYARPSYIIKDAA